MLRLKKLRKLTKKIKKRSKIERFFVFKHLKRNYFFSIIIMQICGYGGMADALGSGPSGGNSMEVQVLLTAPYKNYRLESSLSIRKFARTGVIFVYAAKRKSRLRLRFCRDLKKRN